LHVRLALRSQSNEPPLIFHLAISSIPSAMPQLPETASPTPARRTPSRTRQLLRKLMRSQKVRLPNNFYLPIRLRPWFLVFTFAVMLVLSFLGFTTVADGLPVNDKILHFLCLGLATGLVYFIFDVDEEARRIWIWRNAGLLITAFLCFVLGGIASEFVQSLLPYKTFQVGDIIANLLGSTLGLYVAYNLERHYRHRREISRLYQPLDVIGEDPEDDDGDDTLPVYYSRNQPGAQIGMNGRRRLSDVWDEREDLFNLGDDDDEEVPPEVQSIKSGTAPAGKAP